MGKFRVAEVLKMEGSTVYGKVLDEDLTWREANRVYLSFQGRRKGMRRIEETPNVIRQDDESFVELFNTY